MIRALAGHTVHTAQAKGWDALSNGALLKAAEEAGFDILLTTDRRIRYQQNLSARRIALVVLTGSTKWSLARQHTEEIAAAVATAVPGSYAEVKIPFDRSPLPRDAFSSWYADRWLIRVRELDQSDRRAPATRPTIHT